MCSNHIPVGFVSTRTTVITIIRFVPLTTVWAGLACVGFVDFLKFYVLSIELVFNNLHLFAKIPFRKFLRNFLFANFFLFLIRFNLSKSKHRAKTPTSKVGDSPARLTPNPN